MKYSEKTFYLLGSKIHTYYFYDLKNPATLQKPFALILHGSRADTKRIFPFISLLQEKYNVISFDLPGFGKSRPYKENYDEYISYSWKILKEFLAHQNLNTSELSIFGISLGANILVEDLLDQGKNRFKKVGLMAPIYSYKFLTMKPLYKKFVYWFTAKLEQNGTFTKVMQRIFDNKKLFTFAMILFDIECWKSKKIRDYEYEQWHLQSMQHWGASLKDFLEIDLTPINKVVTDNTIAFTYPRADQYLDVNQSINGFKRLFPNAEFHYFESAKHIPRGDFVEDKEFMASVKKILQNII